MTYIKKEYGSFSGGNEVIIPVCMRTDSYFMQQKEQSVSLYVDEGKIVISLIPSNKEVATAIIGNDGKIQILPELRKLAKLTEDEITIYLLNEFTIFLGQLDFFHQAIIAMTFRTKKKLQLLRRIILNILRCKQAKQYLGYR